MYNPVTIMYPLSYEDSEIIDERKKIACTPGISEGTVRVIQFEVSVQQVKPFESLLIKKQVPYDMHTYAMEINVPRVKKHRPSLGYSKEIDCMLWEDEEDGLIPVSALLEIISSANDTNLKELLNAKIKESSFCFDNVPELSNM